MQIFIIPLISLKLFDYITVSAADFTDYYINLTAFRQHREKRSLIFEGGGSIKLVIGPTLPVNLGDPITWRSVVCSYTLQGGQYPLVTEPLYPWDKWEDIFARSMKRNTATRSYQRARSDHASVRLPHFDDPTGLPSQRKDDSRLFVYTVLESYMNQSRANGRECLLRAICENAQTDQHLGLLAELVNILLTPNRKSDVDRIYVDAYDAGKCGVDCLGLYKKCPYGVSSASLDDVGLNLTDFLRLRQKRSLIFQGGGVLKLAIGPILPFDLADSVPFRSALAFYNFQGGEYILPNSPIYPWNKWSETVSRSLTKKERNQRRNIKQTQFFKDDTRLVAYTAFEIYMNEQNIDGRECLLRAICENAQIVQHIGLLAELLNVFLTPGKEQLSSIYRNAYNAGKSGADCVRVYENCPTGVKWFNQYLDII